MHDHCEHSTHSLYLHTCCCPISVVTLSISTCVQNPNTHQPNISHTGHWTTLLKTVPHWPCKGRVLTLLSHSHRMLGHSVFSSTQSYCCHNAVQTQARCVRQNESWGPLTSTCRPGPLWGLLPHVIATAVGCDVAELVHQQVGPSSSDLQSSSWCSLMRMAPLQKDGWCKL